MKLSILYETIHIIWNYPYYMKLSILYETIHITWNYPYYMKLSILHETIHITWNYPYYMKLYVLQANLELSIGEIIIFTNSTVVNLWHTNQHSCDGTEAEQQPLKIPVSLLWSQLVGQEEHPTTKNSQQAALWWLKGIFSKWKHHYD